MVVVDKLDEGLQSAFSILLLLAHVLGDLSWSTFNSNNKSMCELFVLLRKNRLTVLNYLPSFHHRFVLQLLPFYRLVYQRAKWQLCLSSYYIRVLFIHGIIVLLFTLSSLEQLGCECETNSFLLIRRVVSFLHFSHNCTDY